MRKQAEFLACHGEKTPGRAFLQAYQTNILLVLKQKGILNQAQLENGMARLEKQSNNQNSVDLVESMPPNAAEGGGI